MSFRPGILYFCKNCGKYYWHRDSIGSDGNIHIRRTKKGTSHKIIRTHSKCR